MMFLLFSRVVMAFFLSCFSDFLSLFLRFSRALTGFEEVF